VSTDQAATGPAGVIHDLGYRRYEGPRLGRPAIARALCWHSLRAAFGLGRGARAKIVPFAMLVLLSLPALLSAVLVARSPGHVREISYTTYVFRLRALVMLIFVAVQAPELVSRDLRHHVLPLYLSRPLGRLDYPLAKFAAFSTACLIVTGVPLVLLYLGTVASAGSKPPLSGAEKSGRSPAIASSHSPRAIRPSPALTVWTKCPSSVRTRRVNPRRRNARSGVS